LSSVKLPDYRLKQKLLYIDKTNPDILKKYGDLFMEEGSLSDALDFYQKAGNTEALQKIRKMALESGDVMLFGQAAKALGMELKPAAWESIAEKAVELKKYCFAMHALQKADSEEKLKTLREIMEKEVD
jgi:tetratricopeptide (TPR) repeat protein